MKSLSKVFTIAILCVTVATSVDAQTTARTDGAVSIGTRTPNASSMLEVFATDKGVLLPRVALTGVSDGTTINLPVTSMIVYNTATVTGLTPGYYYWNGAKWNRLLADADITNGLTVTNGQVLLGGALTSATTITTDVIKTLTILGLLSTGATTDNVVLGDATTGALKQKTFSSLLAAGTSVSNSVSGGNVSTTVNGVAGTAVAISNALSSSTNSLSSTVAGGTAQTAYIINSNGLTNTSGSLVSTVNGVAATGVPVLISGSNGLTTTNGNVALGGSLTSATTITTDVIKTLTILGLLSTGATTDNVVLGDATTGALKQKTFSSLLAAGTSVSNSVSGGNVSTTVNGVAGTAVAISNALSSSTNSLSSTVAGGTAQTAYIINSNGLTNTSGSLVSTVNGVAATGVPVLISGSNGLTTTNGNVALGGALTSPTTLITDDMNTLKITGLQSGTTADNVVLADGSTGVLKKITATDANNASTIVARDASKNFSAGTITAALVGNASTATKLAAGVGIYGNNFDGSTALTGIIASTYGGTGTGYAKFTGPTTAEKTFTLPDASATILTTNAAVTAAQGGTGLSSITANNLMYGAGTNAVALLAPHATTGAILMSTQNAAPSWLLLSSLPSTAGILPIANGGTGSTTQNWVDLSTAQTSIAGAKTWAALGTFSAGLTVSGAAVSLNDNSSFATNINTGTSNGAVNIATGSVGNLISIGNKFGTTSIKESVGTGNYTLDGAAGSTYSIGASTVGGTMTIGGTAQTGAITLGNSTAGQTVNIATGNAGSTQALNIGTGTGDKTITIGENVLSANTQINLGSWGGTNSITTIYGGSNTANAIWLDPAIAGVILIGNKGGTGDINVGKSSAAQTVNIGTGSAASTVNISNAGGAISLNGDATLAKAKSLIFSGSTSGTVGLSASATTTTYTLTLPSAQAASAGQTLNNDGTGVLSWAMPSVVFNTLAAAKAANTAIDNLNFAQTWNWSSASTESPLTINTNGLTTGTGLSLASTATTLTGSLQSIKLSGDNPSNTGSLLKLNSSGVTSIAKTLVSTVASTGLLPITGAVQFSFTGAHSGTGVGIDDVTTAGTAMSIKANSLTSGTALDISSSSTAATSTSELLNISATGANATAGTTTTAAAIANTRTGLTSTNVGLSVSASGGLTANTALLIPTGDFDQSSSLGTFKTGTGAISLNGDATLAKAKSLIFSGSTSGTVGLSASATTTTYTLTLPSAQAASAGQTLNNDGTGVLSWAMPSVVFNTLAAAKAANTAIDNLNFAQTWNWSSASTESPLTINTNGLTTGTGLSLASTATTLTGSLQSIKLSGDNPSNTGSLLKLNSSGVTSIAKTLVSTVASTGLLPITGAVQFSFTGAHSGTGVGIDDVTTAGTAMSIKANSLTSGTALDISSSSTAATSTSELLNISATGANATAGTTTTAAAIANTRTGLTSTNVGLSLSASGATTGNTALKITAGDFDQSGATGGTFKTGSGNISLNGDATLDKGKKLTFSGSTSGTVALTAPATITDYTLTLPTAQSTSGQTLSNNGSGALSWVTPSAAFNNITAATAANTAIDNLNFAQTWNWSSASTQSPLTINANSLTDGTALSISSTSTGPTSNTRLLNVSAHGNNAAGGTTTAASISNSNTGATAINTALSLSATNGGSNNTALFIGAGDINQSFSSGGFYSGTGEVALNGNVTVASNKNFLQSGTGTFTTGSGSVLLNGNVTLASNKNLLQSGTGTFTTGSGSVSLNGDATLAAGKSLTYTTGAGNFDQSLSTGSFKSGTGDVTLKGTTTVLAGLWLGGKDVCSGALLFMDKTTGNRWQIDPPAGTTGTDVLTGLILPSTGGTLALTTSPIKTKGVAYTATMSDETILVNAAVTITLPAAATCAGKKFTVKNITTNGSVVTVNVTGGGTIDDAASILGSMPYQGWTFQSDGAEWYIVSRM